MELGADFLGRVATARADHPAIVMGGAGTVVSYRELAERSNQLARFLANVGLARGDVVAVLMENQVGFFETAWAAQRSGLYYAAVNWHLSPDEVAYILSDCGARVLVTSVAQAPLVGALEGRMPVVEVVLCRDGVLPQSTHAWDDVERLDVAALADPTEGCELLYSSGTTGRPKAVKRPLPEDGGLVPNHEGALASYRTTYAAGPSSRYLSPAPLYHSAPLMSCLALHRLGATVVVMERFDAEACLSLIERHRVTHGQFVPTMFVRMLKLPTATRDRYDVSSLELVIHASAPCPLEVKRQMIEWWGPILHEYYGGTEGMGTTTIDSVEWLAHPGSVGRPSGCTIHIVGDDGAELAVGETGVVYFESTRRFEYLNDPAKTASITESHGWRTLGDVGRLDADGYLYLTDRATFMIISGGVNIYPQEIENVLVMHPSVSDVAVFGIPNDEFGEEVKAVVQPASGVAADDELRAALVAFAREHLAGFKVPRSIDFVDELPRDPAGKLFKRHLRDPYWARHATQLV
ncbi:MAG TPA: acyl-CoA synthetase [Acidimicrobiales bacterium]|nr:acyl-CoA synthetase [Acidimicrobiales bacterium]